MFSTSLSLAVVPCLPTAPWAQTWGSWAVHWERCGTAGGSNHTTHPFSSTQSTLGWMSGKKCSQKSGQAVEQAAQGDGGVTWKCSRNTEIGFLRYLRTRYSMHGGDGLRAGLDDLRSIFQPLWFYDLGMGCPQVGCEFFFSHQGHTWRSSRPQALMKRHISVALVSPRWTCSCPPTPRHWEVCGEQVGAHLQQQEVADNWGKVWKKAYIVWFFFPAPILPGFVCRLCGSVAAGRSVCLEIGSFLRAFMLHGGWNRAFC